MFSYFRNQLTITCNYDTLYDFHTKQISEGGFEMQQRSDVKKMQTRTSANAIEQQEKRGTLFRSQKDESSVLLSPKLNRADRMKIPNSLEAVTGRMDEVQETIKQVKNVVVGNVLLASTNEQKVNQLDMSNNHLTEDDAADNRDEFVSYGLRTHQKRLKSAMADDRNGLLGPSRKARSSNELMAPDFKQRSDKKLKSVMEEIEEDEVLVDDSVYSGDDDVVENEFTEKKQ